MSRGLPFLLNKNSDGPSELPYAPPPPPSFGPKIMEVVRILVFGKLSEASASVIFINRASRDVDASHRSRGMTSVPEKQNTD